MKRASNPNPTWRQTLELTGRVTRPDVNRAFLRLTEGYAQNRVSQERFDELRFARIDAMRELNQ